MRHVNWHVMRRNDCHMQLLVLWLYYFLCSFSDNGFLMTPNKDYNMNFTSWSDITTQDFTSNIKTKYITRHNHASSIEFLFCIIGH